MLVSTFRNHFNKELSEIYPATEIDSFFFLLIEEELGLQRIDLALTTQLTISEEKFKYLYNALSRLKAQEPIQYILRKTEFYGLQFNVTKDTLIPRPETEELVDWILTENKQLHASKKINILDIGTGTGCIAISLAKNLPNANVTAIDISKEALLIAKENALANNNVGITFIEADVLALKSLPSKFDIIVSNPPYVRELEKKEIKPNVLENEPHLALFVDDNNPLLFYKKIAELAKNHLTTNGKLFFEINQYLGKETLAMLNEVGYTTELRKDIFGNDRMIKSTC
ncbi:MAG: peptide chain release factor N(5)-glutamine methyltransferase [Flavobacteriaceae bacterium]|nr:peptide chain release factor N(5)-glutamine methyltransferase [Flavobacteriaceae bacterium]